MISILATKDFTATDCMLGWIRDPVAQRQGEIYVTETAEPSKAETFLPGHAGV